VKASGLEMLRVWQQRPMTAQAVVIITALLLLFFGCFARHRHQNRIISLTPQSMLPRPAATILGLAKATRCRFPINSVAAGK